MRCFFLVDCKLNLPHEESPGKSYGGGSPQTVNATDGFWTFAVISSATVVSLPSHLKNIFFKARRKSRIPHGQCDTKFRQYLPHKNNIWHRQRQGVTQHVGAWPGDAQSIGEMKLDKLWDLSLASLVSQRQAEWHHLKIRCHSARGKDKKQARTKHKKNMKPNYTKAKCAQGLGKGGLQMEI